MVLSSRGIALHLRLVWAIQDNLHQLDNARLQRALEQLSCGTLRVYSVASKDYTRIF